MWGEEMQEYSVLMSVYHKEKPEYFYMAARSMLEQTVPTDDFVIVCDGPLTEELDEVLEQLRTEAPDVIHPVRLEKNMGIGYAANVGVQACRHELIAKMDADDISIPDRCQRQLAMFEEDPELAVCGGYIEEFEQDPERPFDMRTVPQSSGEIYAFGRRRQPFNNMTVMYRRSVVLAVGGYSDLRRNEDFDLYARMISSGFKGANLPMVIVKARVDREARQRRKGMDTLKGCIYSRWRAHKIGYASLGDFLYCVAGQLFVVLCPRKLQQWIYAKLLRTRCRTADEKQPSETTYNVNV